MFHSGVAEPGLTEIIVDSRGHRCPVPTLRLRRACEAAPAGATLCLVTDDPLARIDAPHYASQAGFELIGIDSEGSLIRIKVRKPMPK